MATSTRRSTIPILLILLGFLFVLGAVLIFFFLQNNVNTPAIETKIQSGQLTGIPRITLVEAKAAFDSQEAVFVDVRDAASYAEDHIPGSLSIPLTELEARMDELKPEDWVITYCT